LEAGDRSSEPLIARQRFDSGSDELWANDGEHQPHRKPTVHVLVSVIEPVSLISTMGRYR